MGFLTTDLVVLIPEYGEVMTVKDFVQNVVDGVFNDDDGHGRLLLDETHMYPESYIFPSDVLKHKDFLSKHFYGVIWFNK